MERSEEFETLSPLNMANILNCYGYLYELLVNNFSDVPPH